MNQKPNRRKISANAPTPAVPAVPQHARDMNGARLIPAIIRHLPFFTAVAEEEHFHRAAARLNMTQSALSRRIQSLEQELGFDLFIRTQRAARLSAAGKAFYQDVLRIFHSLDRAIGRSQSITRGETGHLHVALNEAAARSEVVTESIRSFRVDYPDVGINLYSMMTEQQIVALQREELDVGFLYDVAIDDAVKDALESILISQEYLVLALYKNHPLAKRKVLHIEDLRHEPLIWPSRENGRHLYDRMIATFLAAGISPTIDTEVTTGESTLSIASANLGMGFVMASERLPKNVVVRKVVDFDVPLRLNLVWRRGFEPPPLRHFIKMLKSRAKAA